MDVEYEGQNAFVAAANGDFPLVVLLWGMAMAVPVNLLTAKDDQGNSILHYAAAGGVDSPDTVHFLIQQMQASGQPLRELVDTRNDAQETPLIRAAHAGNLRIVDALVNFGYADFRAKDADGNIPAHHAAAQGHLWVLHFLLETEMRLVPQTPEKELGGYGKKQYTVLHYACAYERKAMVQYLLARGFDPHASDDDGKTCIDIAKTMNARWLVEVLTEKRPQNEPPTSFRKTRLHVTILYGALLFAILSTSYFLPWWISVPLIVLMLWNSLKAFRTPHGHGHGHGVKKSLESLHPSKRGVNVQSTVALTQLPPSKSKSSSSFSIRSILKPQPEIAMGIWVAWVSLFTLFYIVVWVDPVYALTVSDYKVFLYVVLGGEVIFLLVWFRLAFICPSDPGTIRTYEKDIKVMLEDAAKGYPMNPATYCRTCLVTKPIRSKHCSQCGVCIARHDHHCTWINRCVGYGNHRLFVLFLILHCLILVGYVVLAVLVLYEQLKELHTERVSEEGGDSSKMSASDAWREIPALIRDHFVAVMVLVWGMLAFCALAMMAHQHITNLELNLTVNEQINWQRYPYLTKKPNKAGSTKDNERVRLVNAFDRGMRKNVLEFFSRSGTNAVDYHNVFSIPGQDHEDDKKVLLQQTESVEIQLA